MNQRPQHRTVAFCLLLLLLFSAGAFNLASAASLQRLRNDASRIAARLHPISRLPASTRLRLAIGLPLRNPTQLTNFLHELQNPRSPNYRKYLTPAQFAERFGPAHQDYDAVAAFMAANGLKVTARHPNRMILDVVGSVSDIQRTFHITLHVYKHPTEARTFYAPDAEPTVDLSRPILDIEGLDNYEPPEPNLSTTPPHPALSHPPQTSATPFSLGTAPNGDYMGGDFRHAYASDTMMTGSGQSVALVEFDGYSPTDVTYYENAAGLPDVALTNVLVDGFSGAPSGTDGQLEVTLDIDMVLSMAPDISNIFVYEAGSLGNWDDILNRVATDDLAKEISCSWGGEDETTDNSTADEIFQQMAAQGQSFFTSSADTDALPPQYPGYLSFPSDNPYLTSVGGTDLTTSTPGGPYSSETVWNTSSYGIGSCGGISTIYTIPAWQQGVSMVTNQGSTTMRNYPDVAMTAQNVYVRFNGTDEDVDGTSCAAPLWAGFAALVNQQAALNGAGNIGFASPALYSLASGNTYGNIFHDVTAGNNYWVFSPSLYSAVPGYDLCTGWGSPAGQALIAELADYGDPIQLAYSGCAITGTIGGPFTPTFASYTLNNDTPQPVSWNASVSSPWLALSPPSGTVSGSGTASVTVAINQTYASFLLGGTYSASVVFTDLATGVRQTMPVTLNIAGPAPAMSVTPSGPFSSNGSPGGPFSPLAESYEVVNIGNAPMNWAVSNTSSWLTVSPSGGTLSVGGSATVTASVNANSVVLSSGTYGDTITFDNLTNGAGSASPGAILTVSSPPVTITSATNETAYQNGAFAYQIQAGGNPTGFSVSGIPSGLSFDSSTGIISGTPIGSGNDYIVITASNAQSFASTTLVLNVVATPPLITSPTSAAGEVSVPFSYTIAADNNPTGFGASGLPAGLSLNASTGLISGTPTSVGNTTATITASNAAGTVTASLQINVARTPSASTGFYFLTSQSVTAPITQGTAYTPTNTEAFTTFLGNNPPGGVNAVESTVTIDIPSYAQWGLILVPPLGQYLTPGLYPNAQGYPNQNTSGPGIRFYGAVAADSQTGDIIVLSSSFTETTVNTFAADFYQYDAGLTNLWSIGSIRYNSTIPITYPLAPTISGVTVTNIGTSTATITGNINSNGLPATFYLQYGQTTGYGSQTATQAYFQSITPVLETNPITGLQPNTTYYCQLVAATTSGTSYSADVAFTTVASLAPTITSATAAFAFVNTPFTYSIAASGQPTIFSATGLPSGLSLNTSTGVISGVPTTTGTTYATIGAGNADGAGTAVLEVAILGSPPSPSITSALTATATVGLPFSYNILASNNPTSYGATNLPPALSFNSTSGLITGIPISAGTANIGISASNSGGSSGVTLALTILGPPPVPVINSPLAVTATSGASFYYHIAATNNPFSYAGLGLPVGFSVNTASGVITGTSTTVGTSSAMISANNQTGSGSAMLTITTMDTFGDWQSRWFTPTQLANPAISGETATPAGDAVPNLLKYAFNLNPLTNGVNSLPVSFVITISGTDYLALTYNEYIFASGISYIPEVSADLINWNSGPAYIGIISVTPNGDGVTQTVVVDDLIPMGASPQFMRLEVTGP